MFEGSMKSTGWGFTGSRRKGWEWRVVFDDDSRLPVRSGEVFPSPDKAVREGNKYLMETEQRGYVHAVVAGGRRFEY